MQPYLDLSHHGHPFDIRALVQNKHGRWTLTGCMVREGAEGSLTSNLHGGGKAYPLTLISWIDTGVCVPIPF